MTKAVSTFTLPTFLNERGIGFDKMFDTLDQFATSPVGYPPYNIIQGEDDETYSIELAVAGFAKEDLELEQDGRKLVVTGKKPEIEDEQPVYLHKGISTRSFKREFALAEHVTVTGADYADGILTVNLKRELPEEMKPRTIAIGK